MPRLWTEPASCRILCVCEQWIFCRIYTSAHAQLNLHWSHYKIVPRREKPVVGVSDKARLKPVSLATEISREASLDMILFKKRITKALISLRGCAGWSAPLLFANPRRQVFSHRGPYVINALDK